MKHRPVDLLLLLLLLLSRFSRVQPCATPDSNPSGSPVPGILKARALEWVAISFSGGSPNFLHLDSDLGESTGMGPINIRARKAYGDHPLVHPAGHIAISSMESLPPLGQLRSCIFSIPHLWLPLLGLLLLKASVHFH